MANTQMERCPTCGSSRVDRWGPQCHEEAYQPDPWHSTPAPLDPELEAREAERCRIEGCDPPHFPRTPAAPETAPPQTEEEFVLELAAIYGLDEFFMRALPVPTLEMWKMLVRTEARRHKSERETMEKFRKELCDLKFGTGTPRKEEA